MPHLLDIGPFIPFDDAQMEDLLTLLYIAQQEKAGGEGDIPSQDVISAHENTLVEERTKQCTLLEELKNLQKKGVDIVPDVMQQLVEKNTSEAQWLIALNHLLQEAMIRPAGAERQQLRDNDGLEQHRSFITPTLTRLGFINEVSPYHHHPDALLLLGAAESGFTARLHTTLQYLKESGVEPKALYLLGGQRPLWPVHESSAATLVAERIAARDPSQSFDAVLPDVQQDFDARALKVTDRTNSQQINAFRNATIAYYQDAYSIQWPTELDMMQHVTEREHLDYTVIAVDTPMQPDVDGKLTKRPTTKDTIVSFKNNYAAKSERAAEEKMTVLAISSQPHIPYQRKTIEAVLGTEAFAMEVAGSGVEPEQYTIREALDAVARSIFAGLGISLQKIITHQQSQEREQSLQPSARISDASYREVASNALEFHQEL